MGASLLAKAVYQSTSLVNIGPNSRAGSLPHWKGVICLVSGSTACSHTPCQSSAAASAGSCTGP
ncbi:hypothetical protein ELQ88_08355 [Pseudomonas sp. MPC6]|nr:hypothetical protein ELQ88_08355 [Pseudomonas sp. MPC6]